MSSLNYIELATTHARTCPVCLQIYIAQCECLTQRVRSHSDHWKRLVVNAEHLQMPVELCAAYGVIENADCWRVWEYVIPQDELPAVLEALRVVENSLVPV